MGLLGVLVPVLVVVTVIALGLLGRAGLFEGAEVAGRAAVVAGLCVLLVGSAGWVVWRMAGRALDPVRGLENDLAEINATADLARRMEAPPDGAAGDDEIIRLARAADVTLERLENAVDRQRQFAADASHELRTPITGLRTRIEVALADPGGTDLVGTLRDALGDAERLHQIVDDLLALARLDSGASPERSVVDLTALVSAQLEERGSQATMHAELENDVRVHVNRLQLSRVLENLLNNADRHAVRKVGVTLRTEGDDAVLEVHDDGSGIADGDRERVFERFSRLDSARSRDRGGSGLGLAIAREVVMAHGGSLRVAPSERGARLVMRLPLHDPSGGGAPGRPERGVLRPPVQAASPTEQG